MKKLPGQVGWLAVDQYDQKFLLHEHPRKELLALLGAKHADKIYHDTKTGAAKHVGYVIRGGWLTVYRLLPLAA